MTTSSVKGTIPVCKLPQLRWRFPLYLSLFLCSYTWAKPSSLYINYMYNLYGLLSAVTVRFFRCKGRLPRLIRRLEVYFLQILPSTKSNWQEKPSYEAVPAAGYRIYKIPERFRQRKEPKRGKNKQLGNGRTNHLATNNFLLCYMFTLSDASAKIAK